MMKQTILCVDDEIDNVDALERLFRKGFTVLKAVSGPEALDLLSKNPDVAVIISDQRMPQMTGVELLEKSTLTHPDTIRILLTGYTDIDSVIAAVNFGEIYRYLTKPWDPNDLIKTVTEAAEKYRLKNELRKQNALLEIANKELKALDQSKNQFMILINHELKTPLTMILSYLELLQETPLTDEQKKYISRINQGAHRLKTMVEDSLKIVSGETGLIKTDIRSTNTDMLLQLSPTLNKEMESKAQILKSNITVPNVNADAKIIQEVLNRLIENAHRFGDANSEVHLNVFPSDDKVKFQVQNQGPQIPAETISRILKPFTLNEDIMKHSKGLGLGLSVVSSLLKTHNSQLKIENTPTGVQVEFSI